MYITAQIRARPKSAHRYNVAEQQQIYREEIARIWKAQLDSLSITTEPELSDNEDERDMEQIDSPSAVSLDSILNHSDVKLMFFSSNCTVRA